MSDEKELFAQITADTKAAPPVSLNEVRAKVRELGELMLDKQQIEERLTAVKKKILDVERKDLPDLFAKAKISDVTIEPDGNMPGFYAERKTIYGAKIPDEKKQEALAWFEEHGYGDLVKAIVSIQFGMGDHEARLRLLTILAEAGFEARTDETVHPQTLKAFVTRQLKGGHIIPLDLLGAYFFDVVQIK